MTFLGVVGIVTSPLQAGGPRGSKGDWLERFGLAGRRGPVRAEGSELRERFLLFRVGAEIYGMGLRGLQEVLPPDGVAALPALPSQVCVLLAHRGRSVPVIRARALFEGSQTAIPPTARVLLTRGRRAIGLLVDEVLDMAEASPAEVAPLPERATLLDPACFRGLFTRQDRIIVLLNEAGLEGLDEVAQLGAAGT